MTETSSEPGKRRAFVQLARPHQYLKNGFVWLPLFFGHKLHDPAALLHTGAAFAAFSLTASAVYAFNDLMDVQEDRNHPKKKNRPLARGALARTDATGFIIACAAFSVGLSLFSLPIEFLAILLMYMVLNLTYSKFLKRMAVTDVICISIGFVLRVTAGGYAADVAISRWIIIMTFLLALFLSLAKRRDDLVLSENGVQMRTSLSGYNLEFVSSAMMVMASVIIVAYIMYAVSPEIIQKHRSGNLYLTTFWVIAGLLRYMQITFVERQSGSPTQVLLKDRFLQAVVVLWVLSFYLFLYVGL